MGLTKDEKRALSLRAAIAISSRHGSSHPQKHTDPDLAVHKPTPKMNKGCMASSRKDRKEPEGDCNELKTHELTQSGTSHQSRLDPDSTITTSPNSSEAPTVLCLKPQKKENFIASVKTPDLYFAGIIGNAVTRVSQRKGIHPYLAVVEKVFLIVLMAHAVVEYLRKYPLLAPLFATYKIITFSLEILEIFV